MRKKKGGKTVKASHHAAADDPRQSTGQKVYSLLREQILSLTLPPNSELDEVQFSEELG